MTDKRIGLTLGSYRIVAQIGQGGMATVYKAYQPSMDRYVALKVIPEYHANNADFVQRFIQEARTIARLEHKNILPVYDFGEQDGITYMAMRYLETGTLQDVLNQGQPSLRESVRIVQQICAALDYAHRQGVVHRDVKPSNVMLDGEGNVYLTDFGLAKVLENSSQITATGAILGTPLYMAPEQSLGQPIDGRADIYAAGVILYEMLTGQPPYQADTPFAIALAHVHEPLPLPQTLTPDLPDSLQNIILKALAKDPNDRYQHASEMAAALEEALKNIEPETERPTLQLLTEQARLSRAESMVMPSPEQAAPPPSAGGSQRQGKLWLGVAALLAVMAAIFIFVVRQNQAQPVTTLTEPLLYDSFDNPALAGGLDPSLWELDADEACFIAQQDGQLVVRNQVVDYATDTCDLLVKKPASTASLASLEGLQADILFASGARGQTAGQSLMYNAELPNGNYWVALCGPEKQGDQIVASLWIATISPAGEELQENFYAEYEAPLETDRWYTYRMTLDADNGRLTCWLDDTIIGQAQLDNQDELQRSTIWRGLSAWWDPNTEAVLRVDNFWLIP